jgi:hypothetical protein
MERKFKLNDEVLIVGNFNGSQNQIGNIGRVVEVEPDHYPGDLVYRVLVPGRSETENWHAEQDLELKQTAMTDYKVKGKRLPAIPDNTEYRTVRWLSPELNSRLVSGYGVGELVSYGSKEFNGVTYIIAERPDYTGDHHYMFKESDLISLTEKDTVIGYKLIKEKYREAAKKIALRDTPNFIIGENCDFYVGSRSEERLRDAGLLDLWFEPVYEEKCTTITDSKGRQAKVIDRELHVADGKLTLADLKSLSERYYGLDLGDKNWSVELVSATFDIGCWSGVTLEDINKAIEAIESF